MKAGSYFILTAKSICDSEFKDKATVKKIDGSLQTVFVCMRNVSAEFKTGIASMKAGKAPNHVLDDPPDPVWPDSDTAPEDFIK